MAVIELQVLSLVKRGAQSDRDVARDVVAADGQDGEVPRRAFIEDDDVGGAGPDLDQADAKLDLLGAQDSLARGQPGADDVFDVEARTVHALDHVLDRGLGAGEDVGLDLEPVTRHADRVSHPVLSVHGVSTGDDMDDLAVARHTDRPGCLDDAVNVVFADLVVGVRDGDHAGRILAP